MQDMARQMSWQATCWHVIGPFDSLIPLFLHDCFPRRSPNTHSNPCAIPKFSSLAPHNVCNAPRQWSPSSSKDVWEGGRDLLLERTFLGVLSLGSCLLVTHLLLWRWAFDVMMARGMSLGVVWQGIIWASPLPLSLCAALCMRRWALSQNRRLGAEHVELLVCWVRKTSSHEKLFASVGRLLPQSG